MNSSTPNLDTIREHVNRLKSLLDDAQPGLSTWADMYSKEMQWLSDFWNQEEESPAGDAKTIWKFPLEITGIQNVMMPEGAKILTVQVQGETPAIWAMVNPKAPKQRREIEIIGTGNPTEEANRRYIGTFQQLGGRLVWHAFERA